MIYSINAIKGNHHEQESGFKKRVKETTGKNHERKESREERQEKH
jgi:hypothetical protein